MDYMEEKGPRGKMGKSEANLCLLYRRQTGWRVRGVVGIDQLRYSAETAAEAIHVLQE